MFLKLKRRSLLKIAVGIIYTYIGLVLFPTGVNVGFMPRRQLSRTDHRRTAIQLVILPIGGGDGFSIVKQNPQCTVPMEVVEGDYRQVPSQVKRWE